ncbi:hypothetical protein C8P68_11054 [Mucilaginibacter yixingensis]|uniref:Uncharacterized protein n=1 Tax=Mucilaginibacter yixingensis TaxID=1295612 RepID=A0A2T5J561_9SPHI|nr:hypothetical protein [Mucilaginibacter yixingensis]PTQ92923.1 hypothetical protein C8P68_11054 [Mucilaginibacter yixingensis]
MPTRFFAYARFLFLVSIFFASLNAHGQQVKVKCYGINQTIPAFKADTNFDLTMDNQNILIKKKILTPINQSDAMVEIRMATYPSETMGFSMCTIKFYKDKMQICKYETGVTSINNPNPTKYKGFKEIGPDAPSAKLTHFVKTTDLTANYKQYDWNTLFKSLIDNHLFDMVSGQEFINKVIATTNDNNYPLGEWVTTIQLKVGGRYRNLRYPGTYVFSSYQDNNLIKSENNFINLLNGIFKNPIIKTP